MSKLLVIGGGAAGMMAAIAAAENGHQVHLIEKNEKLGKKIYITGKGRCNLTNASDFETIFGNIKTNPKFLYSALYTFTNENVIEFFEKLGVRLKIERGNRVFPASDKSSDIINALSSELRRLKVKISLHSSAKEVIITKEEVSGVLMEDNTFLTADAVIIATGGLSYPSTGSDGDGYGFARSMGHKVTPLIPSLVPLAVEEDWCGRLQGLSLKNVSLSVLEHNKMVFREFGEMLFTHYGVSGPLVLSASSQIKKEITKESHILKIDLKPALTEEQLDARILKDFEENKNKSFKNALDKLLPQKLIPVMVEYSSISPEKKVNEITKNERQKLLKSMKEFTLTVTGKRGFNEAIITKGGISVKEIDPVAMQSKLVKGVYFAGEILDTDGLTGGFNLQIAWSTGYLAGISIK